MTRSASAAPSPPALSGAYAAGDPLCAAAKGAAAKGAAAKGARRDGADDSDDSDDSEDETLGALHRELRRDPAAALASLRAAGKKEESRRLRDFVDAAHAHDPRVARHREVLIQEMEAMSRLRHPNIIQLYEIFDAPRRLVIAMELATGGDLAERLGRGGTLSEPTS